MSEWHSFAAVSKEDFERSIDELKGQTIKKTSDISIIVPSSEGLSYDLRIVGGNHILFRVRYSKDKLGYERWTTEISQETLKTNLRDMIKEIIEMLTDKRRSETWLEVVKYEEFAGLIGKHLEANTLICFKVDKVSVMDGDIEKSLVSIVKSTDLDSLDSNSTPYLFRSNEIHGTIKKISEILKKKDLTSNYTIYNYFDLFLTLIK